MAIHHVTTCRHLAGLLHPGAHAVREVFTNGDRSACLLFDTAGDLAAFDRRASDVPTRSASGAGELVDCG